MSGLVILAALLLSGGLPASSAASGAAWTTRPTAGLEGRVESSLTGVSCASVSFCMAVGAADNQPAEGGALTDIESFAEREATSWSKPLVAEWNRARWNSVSLPLTPAASGARSRGGLVGVSCVLFAGCTAVGDQPSGIYEATLAQSDL